MLILIQASLVLQRSDLRLSYYVKLNLQPFITLTSYKFTCEGKVHGIIGKFMGPTNQFGERFFTSSTTPVNLVYLEKELLFSTWRYRK